MLYEREQKRVRDNAAALDFMRKEAIKEGMEEGIKKGMDEGIKKGTKERNVAIAKSMRLKGINLATISEITGLTQQDIQALT